MSRTKITAAVLAALTGAIFLVGCSDEPVERTPEELREYLAEDATVAPVDEFGFSDPGGVIETVKPDEPITDTILADAQSKVDKLTATNDIASEELMNVNFRTTTIGFTHQTGRSLVAVVPIEGTPWWTVLSNFDGDTISQRAESKELAIAAAEALVSDKEEDTYRILVSGETSSE